MAIAEIVEFFAIIVNWLPVAYINSDVLCMHVVNSCIIAGIFDFMFQIVVCVCVYRKNLVHRISTSNFIGIFRERERERERMHGFCSFTLDCAIVSIYLHISVEWCLCNGYLLFKLSIQWKFKSANKLLMKLIGQNLQVAKIFFFAVFSSTDSLQTIFIRWQFSWS